MKKSIIACLLLSACHAPAQESPKLNAFRSCRSGFGVGTQEFDECMREYERREKQCAIQDDHELVRLQGGRHHVKDRKIEAEPKKAPWQYPIMIPSGIK